MPRSDTKKSGFFKGVLDGLRSSVTQPVKPEADVEETLRPEHFKVSRTVRHGFPFQPTALAFDPVQRILAIGTKNGSLRLFGRPGVDCTIQHVLEYAVIQILFLVNEGALISVCADDTLHLWNLRQKKPEVVHTLKFQKERITHCHLPFRSKWLYIGTERGNLHVVNIESFTLSGYVINWNKAIELSRKTHPGAVVHVSDNPVDSNKLLIGFETGALVLWDLRNRSADARFQHSEQALHSVAWHHEGKQFMCSHSDGSLTTWNIRVPAKPMNIIFPHVRNSKEGKPDPCKPIYKVEWKTMRGADSFVIFSGGLPFDKSGQTPALTVIHGKTTTVLEMEHNIVDFVTLCETPFQSDFHEPYAVVVLLQNDLVVVDLTSQGYPCFQNPYSMDLHESPVTFCTYLADCPTDLIPAFYSVGSKANKRGGFSEKEWPISGGEWGTSTVSYPEVIITGHADGSLKVWDASSVTLQVLYRLKTSKVFEKPKSRGSQEVQDEDPFAVEKVAFCADSRLLAVAGSSFYVIVFVFRKQEASVEVDVLETPILYEVDDDGDCSPECEYQRQSSQQGSCPSALEEGCRKAASEHYTSLNVKSGPQKWGTGFQPSLVCMLPWVRGETPGHITSLSVNSTYNLLAYGNECGLVIVDLCTKTCVLNLGTPDLYGSSDPYQRIARSPKRNAILPSCDNNSGEQEQCRSPTADQRSIDKLDSSFSRSRSSSMSSLENISSEAILCLSFAEAFCRKSDTSTCPSLWVGTHLGSVLAVSLSVPTESRHTQPVIASPSGSIFRLKGPILSISFLDSSGVLMLPLSEQWKDRPDSRERDERRLRSMPSKGARISPTTSQSLEPRDTQFVVMASEKQARIVALPSQTCLYKATLTETSFVVCAEVLSIKSIDTACLVCYIANGNIVVYSLPSLKPLYETDFLPLVDMRIARTFCFSKNGHGMFLRSPSELQKFTISSDFCANLQEMLGTIFLNKDMPEAPKQSFFKGLFGGGPSVLDREELFGEASGKPSKTVARHIPGSTGNMEAMKAQAGTLAGEVMKARQGLVERGEALSQLEERTARMMTEAESYANTTHQLMNKYKDKKWYQF
ncbi:syntaxin-binding protein 5-like isoform X6 [Dermacentor silvarum]|uniref:syntaxin-binding protein 5-like isoform X6 n=1 Tax=Dermacentor silvarum TaxID=543639 RepID=UPI00189A48BC|nr:syntaxin-binding protein 5-like isoform X6 [Dermacentor silvarum]